MDSSDREGWAELSCLDEFFVRSVRSYGDGIALEIPEQVNHSSPVRLTYRDLDGVSREFAARIGQYAGTDDIVMLAFSRTNPDGFAAVLGTLRSGAAYCALDLSFPDERIKTLIADAKPKLILTEPSQITRFERLVSQGVCIADPRTLQPSATPVSTTLARSSKSLAYVIYTSGTTGVPKGVMIEHGQISNLIGDDLRFFDCGPTDRVLQGSSLSYDSSVEEMFLAWAAGATLVIGSDSTVRMGPDLADWLRVNRVTVFAPPPTLLRTMGGLEVAAQLTELRLLYVGGEALTEDVVRAWAPGRRLVNGYGPTECSVTVLRGEVQVSDTEITIGAPVANHVAYVLDDDLKPVERGKFGELCIAGQGLARGYLNQKRLTDEKFPVLPQMGRVYRTGDLVSRQTDGSFLYHGRIDTQVKLRGYRIELTAIETRLCDLEFVESVACTVQGSRTQQKLVAFVVHKKPSEFSEPDLKDYLRSVLPFYMVPARIVLATELPYSTSGKLDRKLLPEVEMTSDTHEGGVVEPQSEGERTLRKYMAEALSLESENVCVERDFFELGGDSLGAAVFISLLRQTQSFSHLNVRNVYEHRTIRALSTFAKEAVDDAVERDCSTMPPENPLSPFMANVVQLLILLAGALLSVSVAYGMSFVAFPWILERLSLAWVMGGILLLASFAPWFWLPFSVVLTRFVKAVLIGRYRAGQFDIWSLFYVKHWVVQAISRTIPWSLLEGTFLYGEVLRQLGAQVGRDVYFHRGFSVPEGAWDLISIGNGTTLGRDVSLRPLEYLRLEGHLGDVLIGDGCILSCRSGVSHYGRVENGAFLRPHACVRPAEVVPAHVLWLNGDSVPKKMTQLEPRSRPEPGWGPRGYALRRVMSGALLSTAIRLPVAIGVLLYAWAMDLWRPEVLLKWLLDDSTLWDMHLVFLMALMPGLLAIQLLWTGLLVRFLPKIPQGEFSIYSSHFLWAWHKETLMQTASKWLSGTLFWPSWLRLSGMNVGPDCEISTIMEYVPEHVNLRGHCFSADGIYLAVPEIGHGRVRYAQTTYEDGVFLGNHAVIKAGSQMPRGVLLGVCTEAPCDMAEDSSWFGVPSFELPNREVVTLDESLTHKPGVLRRVNRLIWEAARFLIPSIALLGLMCWFRFAGAETDDGWGTVVFRSSAVSGALAMGGVVLILTLKWALLGRVSEGQHGLWSCWCSRWDFVYVMWGAFAKPILSYLEGTQVINGILRLFGVRIGRRVFLGRGFSQVVDPDMLRFSDETTVVNLFQAHSFEDRVLKVAPVYIEQGSSVGHGTVMLYGARVGEACTVGEQSVIMKRERLSPRTHYAGAPTKPVAATTFRITP